jgi:type I restriction enzyme S subunit
MNQQPSCWELVKLYDLVSFAKTGLVRSADQQGSDKPFPYLKMNNINQEGKFNYSPISFIDASAEEVESSKLENGDFIFNTRNSSDLVGKCGIYQTPARLSNTPVLYNNNLLRIKFNIIDPRIVSYWLLSPQGKALLNEVKSATTSVAAIYQRDLMQINVPLPPLAEQTRIAQKLDELLAQVDTLKARLDAIPALLKRFRQSTLAAAVSGRLTEEWRAQNVGWVDEGNPTAVPNRDDDCWVSQAQPNLRTEPFSALIKEMRNGLSAKPNEDGKGTPILRISSVRSGSVEQTGVRYLECGAADQARYALKTGDLLFTRYNGSLDLVGVCGLVKHLKHSVLVYPDKLIRVRADESKILASYLEVYFTSPNMREIVMALVKSTSGQKGISGQDLKNLLISYPSLIEQTEIVRRVEQLFAFADQLEAKVASAKSRIDHLTQSILAKAFRGELVPQDPNDEPASVLFARIQTQHAAAPKAKRGRKSA